MSETRDWGVLCESTPAVVAAGERVGIVARLPDGGAAFLSLRREDALTVAAELQRAVLPTAMAPSARGKVTEYRVHLVDAAVAQVALATDDGQEHRFMLHRHDLARLAHGLLALIETGA